MARVCKRNGIVALADNVVPPDRLTAFYINDFERMRDQSHNWTYPIPRLQAMFADAGLKVEHIETFVKEMEFDPWVDRTGASKETKAKLRKMLDDAPDSVREWLTPQRKGNKVFFTLHEAIIIGRRT
jgi:hypothetical protein